MIGKPVGEYDGVAVADPAFVRGGWDGDPAVDPPSHRRHRWRRRAARYGVAFLAVRRIAEKYGQDKMLDFFGQVVHDDGPPSRRRPRRWARPGPR